MNSIKIKPFGAIALMVCLLNTACGPNNNNTEKEAGISICTPGEEDVCFCVNGDGVKKCRTDGSGWGKCQCSGGDSDTDTDADMDTDADTDTDTDTYVSDAGTWEWEKNPKGEDCGAGCVQLTFENDVKDNEWDVWNNYLVYKNEATYLLMLVDIKNGKYVRIHDVHSEYPIGPGISSPFSPTIYKDTLVYSLSIYKSNPTQREIINCNLLKKIQKVIWSIKKPSDKDFFVPEGIDNYQNRIVTMGGCGDLESRCLCVFEPPWPSQGEVLINETYGGYNSLWGDVVVFFDIRRQPDDITAYDFEKQEFISITDDDKYQIFPRIHENRVVYMELGSSPPWGNWAGSAVVVHDLETSEKTQATSGEWIAAEPDVFGDIVVWSDYRGCDNPNDKNDFSNVEVWGYNLKTQQEFQITNLPGRKKAHPRIWGDKVFVQMYRKSSTDTSIYMFDLP